MHHEGKDLTGTKNIIHHKTLREEVVSDKQYRVHKAIYDAYLSRDCAVICDTIYRHYKVSIEKLLGDNHMSDTNLSFDIINPDMGVSD